MSGPENKNGQQGEQVRGVGKSHAVDLIIIRSMLEKEKGGTLKKRSPIIMACHIRIVAACTCCEVTNTLCL
jgi:hypothetical protein